MGGLGVDFQAGGISTCNSAQPSPRLFGHPNYGIPDGSTYDLYIIFMIESTNNDINNASNKVKAWLWQLNSQSLPQHEGEVVE